MKIIDLSMEISENIRYNNLKGGIDLERSKSNLHKIFLGIAGCIVLYWLLTETERLFSVVGAIAKVFSPFIVGASIAFVLNVPMRGFESCLKKISKRGLRRALAMVLTVISVLLVLYGVIYLLVPQIGETVESIISTLPGFFGRVQESVMEYLAENPELLEWLSEYTDFNNMDWGALIQDAIGIVTTGLGSIVDVAISTVVSLGNGIFNAVLSVVFALYCLARKEILARQGRRLLYSVLKERTADEIIRVLRMTNQTFSRFISGQCLEAVILGSMFAVTMPIFGMPYMPLISVIISVTALVPIVGAFVGCILGAFFILVANPLMAFWFVVLFLVLQQLEGNLIYPRVVGSSVGLPGMWVLVAVAVGGDLMGVGGMLLMIPLASVFYSLLREWTGKRLSDRGIDREKLQEQPFESGRVRVKKTPKKKKKDSKATENE